MHFPVIVITETDNEADNISALLAPYCESAGAEKYVELRYPEVKKALLGICEKSTEWYVLALAEALDQDDIGFIRELNEEIGFFDEINEQGDAVSDYNPLGKWDFWGYGGRWMKILNGECMCRLKDFPRIRNEDTEEILKEKFPMIYEGWEGKAADRGPGSSAFLQFLKTHYCYALVTPSGDWIEPGRYAWWLGALAAKEADIDWVEEFNRILDGFPGDYYANLIDCHI